jgi:hypothetical protein
MRRWLAILGFCFLAACQQPSATGASQPASDARPATGDIPSGWSAGENGAPRSKYFAEEMSDVRKRMVAGLFGNCYGRMQNRGEMDSCLREGLVAAFDDSGQGRRNCDALKDIDGFTDCIIIGNMIVDVAHRLDANAKIDSSVWTGRRTSADFLGKLVVMSTVAACADAQTDASATRCAFDHLQSKLQVPERLAKKCSADLSSDERGSCLAQASTVHFLQEHVSRLPALST